MQVPPWLKATLTGGLVLIAAVLRVAALFTSQWASYTDSKYEKITMSLTDCSDCPQGTKRWGWDCFQGDFCDIKGDDSACEAFKHGYTGSFCVFSTQYLALESLSLLLFALVLQRLLYRLFAKDSGPGYSLLALAVLQATMHLAAVISWAAITRAGFSSCDSGLCAEAGAKVSIAAVSFNLAASAAIVLCFRRTEGQRELWLTEGSGLCRVKAKWWFAGALLLQLAAYALVLWSIAARRWVKREREGEVWSGGLLKCHDCPLEAQRVGWDCFAGVVCSGEESSLCELYANLRDAGRTVIHTQYFALSLAVLAVLLFWTESTLYLLVKRNVGDFRVNCCYPYIAIVLQTVATILWFVKSETSVSSDCSTEDNEEEVKLCRQEGPAIAISALFTLACATVVHTVALCQRGKLYEQAPSAENKPPEIKEIELSVSEV